VGSEIQDRKQVLDVLRVVGLSDCRVAVGLQPVVQATPIHAVVETIREISAFPNIFVNLVEQFRSHGYPTDFETPAPKT